MYEKENKLSQAAPISEKVNFQLSDTVYRNINEKWSSFL